MHPRVPTVALLALLAPRTHAQEESALGVETQDERRARVVSRVPAAYGGRFGPKRGRTRAVREAIETGLAWLVEHQEADGNWDCDRFDGSPIHDVGVTGLALLALLGDGNTGELGPHRESVARGTAWLVRNRDAKTGLIGTDSAPNFIYDHAIATLALVEAWGLADDPALREPAQHAVDFLSHHRSPLAAWRYQPRGNDSDTSVTGWCWQAYHAAAVLGLDTDDDVPGSVERWLNDVTDPATYRTGYLERGGRSSRLRGVAWEETAVDTTEGEHAKRFPPDRVESTTASALWGRLLLGRTKRDPSVAKAAALLLECAPGDGPADSSVDELYWYHATHALHLLGDGRLWRRWTRPLHAQVLGAQVASGDDRGSWNPVGVWAGVGGRVFSTSLMVLTLEAEFRVVR